MPPPAIRFDGAAVDLSSRYLHTSAVTGSPAAAAETIIATLPALGNVALLTGVFLEAWAAFTAGTNGVSATMRIRQTNASGTVIANTGAVTVVAASLYTMSVQGLDTAAVVPGQVYVATLQVGSASAASTVSATDIIGVAV